MEISDYHIPLERNFHLILAGHWVNSRSSYSCVGLWQSLCPSVVSTKFPKHWLRLFHLGSARATIFLVPCDLWDLLGDEPHLLSPARQWVPHSLWFSWGAKGMFKTGFGCLLCISLLSAFPVHPRCLSIPGLYLFSLQSALLSAWTLVSWTRFIKLFQRESRKLFSLLFLCFLFIQYGTPVLVAFQCLRRIIFVY